ncbi:MAG: acyltransferase [Alsobacter sp.]
MVRASLPPAAARSPLIDALRGVAILLVILFHYGLLTEALALLGAPAPVRWIAASGWQGVTLFFVLSAFLLGGQLLERTAGATPGEAIVRPYLMRRLFRTAPLFLVVFVAALAARRLLPGEHPLVAWSLGGAHPLWAYAGLQNWVIGVTGTWGGSWLSTTWSLATEEQFYLLLPLLVLAGPRATVLAALAFIPLAFCARVATWALQGDLAAYVWTPGHLDSFGAGLILAVAVRRGWRPGPRQAAALLAAALAVLLALFSREWTEFHMRTMLYGHPVAVLAMAAGLWSLLALEASWTAGRAGAVLRWCGTRCYALYLVHQPVLALVLAAAGLRYYVLERPGQAVWIALALGVTLVLSEILHRSVEQPCIAWGKRLAARTRAEPSRPVPAAPA